MRDVNVREWRERERERERERHGKRVKELERKKRGYSSSVLLVLSQL